MLKNKQKSEMTGLFFYCKEDDEKDDLVTNVEHMVTAINRLVEAMKD